MEIRGKITARIAKNGLVDPRELHQLACLVESLEDSGNATILSSSTIEMLEGDDVATELVMNIEPYYAECKDVTEDESEMICD